MSQYTPCSERPGGDGTKKPSLSSILSVALNPINQTISGLATVISGRFESIKRAVQSGLERVTTALQANETARVRDHAVIVKALQENADLLRLKSEPAVPSDIRSFLEAISNSCPTESCI